ncbi:MAG: 1-(5-phosphoribosyl)-5-[(5-phosphoribosylamino)methylideneamino]imidazole-4-carboxamide isomerase [Pirellulales bacterium]|nr:1-(5-phosphoribosyl)-5-[(5-phosphoribosylamino)methylideneamino]imidazole-4-carboxamide isomerase [Pirellulales bacterium]
MEIWPAIDLCGGKCVRLAQGDFDRETVYGTDPVAIAGQFESEGARFLHLVDLDAARSGRGANRDSVAGVVKAVGMHCELGGGVRDDRDITELLSLGLHRLVVGTAALVRPDWFRAACHRWPGQLVLGLDAREGRVATDGWLATSEIPAVTMARQFSDAPLAAIVYTDIATDGMLTGPNIPAIVEMCLAVPVPVIASGGVRTVDDVRQLATIGVAGCIIGRALYEGTITLRDAIAVGRNP